MGWKKGWKKYYREKKEKGICVYGGCPRKAIKGVYCEEHRLWLKLYRDRPDVKERKTRWLEEDGQKYMCEYMKRYLYPYLKKRKLDLIRNLGGKCQICGFSDIRALEIHHLNRKLSRTSYEYQWKHLFGNNAENSVMLLCANCHKIITSEEKKITKRLYS